MFTIQNRILTRYQGNDVEVVIPNSVTAIGEGAFAGCGTITKIVIPNSVTSIQARAFQGCFRLQSVTLPNSLRYIGVSAFEKCVSLGSILIPNGITVIETCTFLQCQNLKSVFIPNTVTGIGPYAFMNCPNLQQVYLPLSATNIAQNAFGNTKLIRVGRGQVETQQPTAQIPQPQRPQVNPTPTYSAPAYHNNMANPMPVSLAANNTPTKAAKKKSPIIPIVICMIVVLLVAVVVGILAFWSTHQKQAPDILSGFFHSETTTEATLETTETTVETIDSTTTTVISMEETEVTTTVVSETSTNGVLNVDKMEENTQSFEKTTIDSYKGRITAEGQEDVYNFTPEVDGIYRFEFSDIPNNVRHSMSLYNSSNEQLDKNSDIGNGSGITVKLDSTQSYTIKVSYCWNTGSYTLNIGHAKKIETITGFTQISDFIEFTDQENDYVFVPEIDGTYRFEFSDLPNNVKHSMYVYNSYYEELAHNSDIGDGSGITIELEAGQEYHILIKQCWNFGSYKLNIGYQKKSETITGLTQVSDSIEYTDQKNEYIFVPEIDGTYCFEFSDIPNDVKHSMYVYNSDYEELERNTDIGNESGITIEMEAGQEYHIVVRQCWNFGSYKLNIGSQNPDVDIEGN